MSEITVGNLSVWKLCLDLHVQVSQNSSKLVKGMVDQSMVSVLPRRDKRLSQQRPDLPIIVSAPMVRYSKLPFRLLVRSYGTDVTYTPMMLAHEFIRSSIARDSDFTTCPEERSLSVSKSNDPPNDERSILEDAGAKFPTVLIAQFASSDPEEFARAAELIAPWVDGVDLNCGCPQSWAIQEGIGCSLMQQPETVAAMVRAAKARLTAFAEGHDTIRPSVSVKIRIHKDLSITENFIRMVQDAGVDYITIHGRTKSQRSSTPPDLQAIAKLKAICRVPVVANGDAYSAADVAIIVKVTGADGVMAARGILENPAMFAGFERTPEECVRVFLESAIRSPIPFPLVLHHVSDMTTHMPGMTKKEKRRLMECTDLLDLIDYIEEQFPVERMS